MDIGHRIFSPTRQWLFAFFGFRLSNVLLSSSHHHHQQQQQQHKLPNRPHAAESTITRTRKSHHFSLLNTTMTIFVSVKLEWSAAVSYLYLVGICVVFSFYGQRRHSKPVPQFQIPYVSIATRRPLSRCPTSMIGFSISFSLFLSVYLGILLI